MRIVHGLWFFYQRLVVPSLVLSVLLSYFIMERSDFVAGVGISFVFLTPVFQYFTYEVKNPNAYYFYYNLGLSKVVLWITTIVVSLVFGLILTLL